MHGTCGERRKKKDGEEKNNNRKEQIVHDQITMTMSTRYAVRYTHGHDHTLLYYRRFLRRPFSSLHTLAADNILLIFFCLSVFLLFSFLFLLLLAANKSLAVDTVYDDRRSEIQITSPFRADRK